MHMNRGRCAPLKGVAMGRGRPDEKRFWAAVWCAALAGALAAADPNLTLIRGFRYPEYDEQGRLKMEVAGDEAQAQSQDLIRIKNLHMVFYEEGRAVTEISAPDCLFDRARRVATSTSAVTIARAEAVLSGEGFVWRAADGSFAISNNTRVVLKKMTQE